MVENVGIAQVIFTVEPDQDNAENVVITYWLQNSQKIGSMTVPRG